SPDPDPQRQARAFNMELRAPDATASPYMVIGAMVRAGLAGIKQKLPLPQNVDCDPSDISENERLSRGIVPLPASLQEALDLMEGDAEVGRWMSPVMKSSYVAVKRKEIDMFAKADVLDMCRRYQHAY
ncbi:MAG: glutamine synthetase, partial [Rhodospirillaceae bacterium]